MTVDRGCLVVVATPIGNLGDLAPRAIEVLSTASLICCEDTRRTGRLLQHAGVTAARLTVANEHTERDRLPDVLQELAAGNTVAIVTDAGTPAVSDPGERLVRAALDGGYPVTTVPGPSAAIAALTVSGLPTARFVFEGFLPRSGRDRRARLEALAPEPRTVVLYEAPHRVERTMADLIDTCGPDRRAAVVRELTKLYEQVVRGTLAELQAELGDPRGEYVIVLDGQPADDSPPDDDTLRDALREELARGVGTKAAAAAVAERFGVAKRATYALALGLRSSQ